MAVDFGSMNVGALRAFVRDHGIRRGTEVVLATRETLLKWIDESGAAAGAASASAGAGAGASVPSTSGAAVAENLNAASVAAAVRPSVLPGVGAGAGDLTAAAGALAAAVAAMVKPSAPGVDREAVEEIARAVAAEVLADARRVVHEVRGPSGVHEVNGKVNNAFSDVLDLTAAGLPVLMVGPAGTGKTHLAGQVAESLGLPFGFCSLSAGVTESKIIGSLLPTDGGRVEFVPGQFAKIYENGGVFLFDEIDNADPNVLVFLNSALANGELSIPGAGGRVLKKHKDCHILAAANTFGTGPNAQYTGRNRLDASTLDRFAVSTVKVGYDVEVEREIVRAFVGDEKAEKVLSACLDIRAAINTHGLKRIMSTRTISTVARMVAAGWSVEKCLDRYFVSWSDSDLIKVGRK